MEGSDIGHIDEEGSLYEDDNLNKDNEEEEEDEVVEDIPYSIARLEFPNYNLEEVEDDISQENEEQLEDNEQLEEIIEEVNEEEHKVFVDHLTFNIKLSKIEDMLEVMKKQINNLEDKITNLQELPSIINVVKKHYPAKVSSASSYLLNQSQCSIISKFVSNLVIHQVKFLDKAIEFQKGQEYAKACAKKICIPENDIEQALPAILVEIKCYVTTCRNNQVQDIRSAFYGKIFCYVSIQYLIHSSNISFVRIN